MGSQGGGRTIGGGDFGKCARVARGTADDRYGTVVKRSVSDVQHTNDIHEVGRVHTWRSNEAVHGRAYAGDSTEVHRSRTTSSGQRGGGKARSIQGWTLPSGRPSVVAEGGKIGPSDLPSTKVGC